MVTVIVRIVMWCALLWGSFSSFKLAFGATGASAFLGVSLVGFFLVDYMLAHLDVRFMILANHIDDVEKKLDLVKHLADAHDTRTTKELKNIGGTVRHLEIRLPHRETKS